MTPAPAAVPPARINAPWRVLIVDDEPDVHDVTRMALARFRLDDRGLEFLHAHSAGEARAILEQERDIALLFLDVVMETDNAGLDLARWLRQEQGNHFTRIVLRTGQPGQAPEEKVIVEYDINDYKEKTELDRKKLFTTVFAALRAYRDLMQVEEARQYQERYRLGLERVITASAHVFEQRNLRDFANGLLQQIVALLRLNEHSLLVRLRGVSALPNENDYEVLAHIGEFAHPERQISPDVLVWLNRAREHKQHLLDGDVFVGYFASRQGKVNLLYLKGVRHIDSIDEKLIEVFSGNVSVAFDNLLLTQEVIDTQGELIYRLGDVVESRSQEAGNHVKRMSELCYMLARACGLPEDEAEILRRAAPMHDIGKIATPDAVLLKPGKLTDEEWQVMKQHPQTGFNILDGSQRPILRAAAILSHQHHERYDGSGYPQGLHGDTIHLYARILAVCDVFDALTHARCYKPAWSVEDTVTHMRAVRGTHLDAKLVDLFLQHLDAALLINSRFPE